jgi:hypothetical protein
VPKLAFSNSRELTDFGYMGQAIHYSRRESNPSVRIRLRVFTWGELANAFVRLSGRTTSGILRTPQFRCP